MITVLSLVFFVSVGFAEMHSIADMKECQTSDIQWKNGEIMLHMDKNHKPQIYFLHNTSNAVFLWLNHAKPNSSASAGWGSHVKAGNWSAMMVSQPRFKLTCAQWVDNKITNISCDGILEACHFNHFENRSGAEINTTFWIAEDGSIAEIDQQMRERKIFLILSDSRRIKNA